MKYLKSIIQVAALFVALLPAFVSCGKLEEEPDTVVPEISVPKNPADGAKGAQFVSVHAGKSWTLSLEYLGNQKEWAQFDSFSGSGDNTAIVFSYSANPADTSRYVVITLKSEGGMAKVTFRQLGGGEAATPYNGVDKTTLGWLELPETYEGDGRKFFYHNMYNSKQRNYSYDYSFKDFVSLWVAYPLNKGLIGSGARTDAWGFDPLMPDEYQQYLYDRGRNKALTYGTGHTRGHQIPSADRYGNNNESTFYATNMTPQDYNFNSGIWARLEGNVRNLAGSSDTLYVVTGCVLGGNSIKDKAGNQVAVPDAYFKALLYYSGGGGIYSQHSGYSAVGVYMSHESSLDGCSADYAMTIEQLQLKTGLKFFVNLPEPVRNKILTQKPDWLPSYWYNQ